MAAIPDRFWTLDQALIWIASRDADAVVRARSRPPSGRLTWATHLIETENSPRMDGDEAEARLLLDLSRDRLAAWIDGEKVDPPVFLDAQPRIEGDLSFSIRTGKGDICPVFIPEEVKAAYPPAVTAEERSTLEERVTEAVSLPNGERGVKAQPKREYAKRLLGLAFPEGVPARGGALEPGDLILAAFAQHVEINNQLARNLQKPDPLRDTILRAAGWK